LSKFRQDLVEKKIVEAHKEKSGLFGMFKKEDAASTLDSETRLKFKLSKWPEGYSNENILLRNKVTTQIAQYLSKQNGRFTIKDLLAEVRIIFKLDTKAIKELEFEVKTTIMESKSFTMFDESGTMYFKKKA
jgi:hypothetical protein